MQGVVDAVEESTEKSFDYNVSYDFQAVLTPIQSRATSAFNEGNAVVLPEHVLEKLAFWEAPTPYIFEVFHQKTGRWTHVTVREFTQPDDGTCLVPDRVRETLEMTRAGGRVMLRYVQLPLATRLSLQVDPPPLDYTDFAQAVNARVKQVVCLTQGDTFRVVYGNATRTVFVGGVSPDLVRGVALISQDENRVVEIALSFTEPEPREGTGKRPLETAKTGTVFRLPDFDYGGPVALALDGAVPRRVLWFAGWNMPGGGDALLVNSYAVATRLTVRDNECDVCGNALLGEPAEEFQFLPRPREALFPLASLALHKGPGRARERQGRAGDDRRDGIVMPAERSLDLRHLECQMTFAARAFVSTGNDYAEPAAATVIPELQMYPGQRVRTTLAWEKVPELWLLSLLTSQTVTFSTPEEELDAPPREEEPLGKPFFLLLGSLQGNALEAQVRQWAERAKTVFFARLEGLVSGSAEERIARLELFLQVPQAKVDLLGESDKVTRNFLYAVRNDSAAAAQEIIEKTPGPERESKIDEIFLLAAAHNASNVLRELAGTQPRRSFEVLQEAVDEAIEECALDAFLFLASLSADEEIFFFGRVLAAAKAGAHRALRVLLDKTTLSKTTLRRILFRVLNGRWKFDDSGRWQQTTGGGTRNYLAVVAALMENGADVFVDAAFEEFAAYLQQFIARDPETREIYAFSVVKFALQHDETRPSPGQFATLRSFFADQWKLQKLLEWEEG